MSEASRGERGAEDSRAHAGVPEYSEPGGGNPTEELGRCLCAEFSRATETAALAAGRWMGQGDAEGARRAATAAMGETLAGLPVSGRVIMSEGEPRRGGPLSPGATVGTGGRPCGLAASPLEAPESLVRGQWGALSVLAVAGAQDMMATPHMYMEKIVVGPRARGAIDIDASVSENLRAIAEAYDRRVVDLSIITLDRPRHEDLIEEIRWAGARIKLISDGDISAAISTAVQGTGDHAYIGIGGAAEAILTAAAMRSLGGEIQARFWPLSRSEIEAARELGIEDIEAKLTTDDMVRGDVVFSATGVTRSDFLRGVFYFRDGARTHSLVMCTRCRNVRFVDDIHLFSEERRGIRL